jgi:hypothetical protein
MTSFVYISLRERKVCTFSRFFKETLTGGSESSHVTFSLENNNTVGDYRFRKRSLLRSRMAYLF